MVEECAERDMKRRLNYNLRCLKRQKFSGTLGIAVRLKPVLEFALLVNHCAHS